MKAKPIEPEITDDDMARYLGQWRSEEGWCDLGLALDRGLLLMATDIIVGAGVINSKTCYPTVRDVEAALEKLHKSTTKAQLKKELDEFNKLMEVWIHKQTNEHYFFPVGDRTLDYFVDQKQLKGMGYQFAHGYDAKGKAYKTSRLAIGTAP